MTYHYQIRLPCPALCPIDKRSSIIPFETRFIALAFFFFYTPYFYFCLCLPYSYVTVFCGGKCEGGGKGNMIVLTRLTRSWPQLSAAGCEVEHIHLYTVQACGHLGSHACLFFLHSTAVLRSLCFCLVAHRTI